MKAIVTGHSRGLGAAIAGELLSRGIGVLGLARHPNARLAQRFPALLEQVALDLSDTAALAGWLAEGAWRRYLSGCDTVLLINNAGTVQPIGALQDQEAQAIARAVSLNVTAPLMLASALADCSDAGSDIRIAHIGSGAGRNAYAGWSVYCATKAALDHHARAVALDRRPGVRIASIAPGVIDTDMQGEIRDTSALRFPTHERFQAYKRDGLLSSPEHAAQRVVEHVLSGSFGQAVVADMRA